MKNSKFAFRKSLLMKNFFNVKSTLSEIKMTEQLKKKKKINNLSLIHKGMLEHDQLPKKDQMTKQIILEGFLGGSENISVT